MANLIHRVVLFKVTDADKQTQLLKATDKLSKENSKVCSTTHARHQSTK